MLKLKVTEEWRVETKEEAESFIKTQRQAGAQEGYEVLSASYTHKEKKAKGEVIDECEVCKIQKEYNAVWSL